jgi:hypothetical protein
VTDNGSKHELSFLWDGSQMGWSVERRDDEILIEVRLAVPLGELESKCLDALRDLLGEWRYNRLSAFDRLILVDPTRAKADELHLALCEAGFDSALVIRRCFSIVRDVDGDRSALIVEDSSEHEEAVERMIAAGMPVHDLRSQGR